MADSEKLFELTGGVRVFVPSGGEPGRISEPDSNLAKLNSQVEAITYPFSRGLALKIAGAKVNEGGSFGRDLFKGPQDHRSSAELSPRETYHLSRAHA